jgi:hypothetical protein
MKRNEFQLSPNFNRRVIDRIKDENLAMQNEIKQLWRFTLWTTAGAALLAFILMINLSEDNNLTSLDLLLQVDEFELTLDEWSNN